VCYFAVRDVEASSAKLTSELDSVAEIADNRRNAEKAKSIASLQVSL
jgi:hypothetical protein